MDWKEKYTEWKNSPQLEKSLLAELSSITDEKELEERFYKYLEFGTGGMRGEIGIGINRINQYTIKRVALSLAEYIKKQGSSAVEKGVVIAYDNRYFSKDFAEATACVLASEKIFVYLSDAMRPTPELSFLVRDFGAYAGVMITASHNPKEYNGFKVYGTDGGQITLEMADELTLLLENITNELSIDAPSLRDCQKNGYVKVFSNEADDQYLERLAAVIQKPEMIAERGIELSIIYTPLHGTGAVLIPRAFEEFGFSNVHVVQEQADGNSAFATVASPNPEDPQAFSLALKYAAAVSADIAIATDPDADRLGVVVFNAGQPTFLNGNQIGVLLLDYLVRNKLSQSSNLKNFFLAKTIVTSELGSKIAEKYQIETRNTLTGFKFIGEQIQQSEINQDKCFLFGYEESFGYLVQPFVRDKDAIQAAVLLAEAALYYKLRNSDLIARLEEIYQEFGFYFEMLESKEFRGREGSAQMNRLLEHLRHHSIPFIGSMKVAYKEDYSIGKRLNVATGESENLTLPTSNVLKFIFDEGSWVCVRPSGTEPKFKIYYSVNDQDKQEAKSKLTDLIRDFQKLLVI